MVRKSRNSDSNMAGLVFLNFSLSFPLVRLFTIITSLPFSLGYEDINLGYATVPESAINF